MKKKDKGISVVHIIFGLQLVHFERKRFPEFPINVLLEESVPNQIQLHIITNIHSFHSHSNLSE